MATDAVQVEVRVGTPAPGVPPVVLVSRIETVVSNEGNDLEQYAIEALRVVDRLCQDVRAEALRQVRVTMENIQKQEATSGAE